MDSPTTEPAANALHLAGTYRRDLKASMARVWENVFDWEHLPSLHDATFAKVELIDSHPKGNRLRLISQPGDPAKAQVIELEADVDGGRYVVTTREGVGVGSQIRTRLTPLGPHSTRVEVEFHIPEARPDRLAKIGARYEQTYGRLWDEDEEMMRVREAALARRRERRAARSAPLLDIGEETDVRGRLPLMVEFAGERIRIIALDGALVAHAADCPHWLGPLDDAPVVDGCIRCPWHGYSFDVRSGLSADGRGLKLATPPQVRIEHERVTLYAAQPADHAPH
jgi:nitrite reductase/ring-hydroxylating ferredoxin subunit